MKNKEIATDTVAVLERGYYDNHQGERIDLSTALSRCKSRTKYYDSEKLRVMVKEPIVRRFDTEFVTLNQTTIATLIDMGSVLDLSKTMRLNFASAKNPGGGFLIIDLKIRRFLFKNKWQISLSCAPQSIASFHRP